MNVQWAASSTTGGVPQFAFQNVQAGVGSTTVSVSGQIVNDDVASFGSVLIIVVFKDDGGNPIGASQTEINDLAPGTTQNFTVIYPAVPGINPANNEIEHTLFGGLCRRAGSTAGYGLKSCWE